jgi:Fe-S-cluster-containing hydrogenase component 2
VQYAPIPVITVDNMDQACVQVCPVDAIAGDPSADRKMFIDPAACIACGSCASVCPNGAIYVDSALPSEYADYAWLDAAWFRDAHVAREVLVEVLEAPLAVAS